MGKSVILFHVVSSGEEEDELVKEHQEGMKHALTSGDHIGPALQQRRMFSYGILIFNPARRIVNT